MTFFPGFCPEGRNNAAIFYYYKTLRGGCTRFEVEHISCNLLLYIGKT